jgi:hypothetical protein
MDSVLGLPGVMGVTAPGVDDGESLSGETDSLGCVSRTLMNGVTVAIVSWARPLCDSSGVFGGECGVGDCGT